LCPYQEKSGSKTQLYKIIITMVTSKKLFNVTKTVIHTISNLLYSTHPYYKNMQYYYHLEQHVSTRKEGHLQAHTVKIRI
jgi:hypothetical protein